ncbi:E3 ubiquitin-protein ligase TRIM71-like [Branchiostoma floridae]|uniref:E3 ubiquitin-protein ligase TRIM71-like n=1 Tax=Branchiostoma floridae TaxID=7739 RepID=A0A9J7LVD5_BRAFL|nr:E3 ubiquitin-protein ligase TRIM71-like [Branchiostoma floridae]
MSSSTEGKRSQQTEDSRITFGGRELSARGVTVSSQNEIVVADNFNKRIQVYNVKGVFLRNFSTEDKYPIDVSVDRNGHLWVIWSLFHESVYKYEPGISQFQTDGRKLAEFDGRITGTEYWFAITYTGIVMDSQSDNIIVTGGQQGIGDNWRVWVYRPNGSLVRRFGHRNMRLPTSVAVDNEGNIFIADGRLLIIYKYDKNGRYLFDFDDKGTGTRFVFHFKGVCVDNLGQVIVTNADNNRVEMFTRNGTHIRTIANVSKLGYVATGKDGQLVVVNPSDDTVTIFPSY